MTFRWPCHDLGISQGHGNVKIYHQCAIWSISAISESVDIRVIWRGFEKNHQPLCYPCNPTGVIWCRSCWDLGMFQAIIYISSEQNVSKNNKNKLFPTVLSWFDLAVTLKWPYHDLGITPLWYQTPTDVTCVLGLGFDRVIWSAGPTIHSQPFWADLTLLWPWDDLTKTLG